MKVYVVAEDTYKGGYGSDIELFGIYSTKEQAEKRYNEIKTGNEDKYLYEGEYGVYEMELNKDCRIDLGGYIE